MQTTYDEYACVLLAENRSNDMIRGKKAGSGLMPSKDYKDGLQTYEQLGLRTDTASRYNLKLQTCVVSETYG